MISSSGKETEEKDNAQNICFLYKVIPGSKDTDDSFFGFHQEKQFREQKLSNKKTAKEN